MFPVLFAIGDFKVYASITFLILGILAGIVIGRVEARAAGFHGSGFYFYSISVIPVAIGLATLNGLVFEIALWNIQQNFDFEGSGGLISFGAVLGALAWGAILARVTRQSVFKALDVISLVLPLILGVYRIGCLLNGCCHGMETSGFLGVRLPGGNGVWAPRYPTQIMLMLLDFGIFGWLWLRSRKKPFQGELTLSFLLLYSLGRLVIDAFRDLPHVLGPLSLHQLSSLALMLVAIGVAQYLRRARRRTQA